MNEEANSDLLEAALMNDKQATLDAIASGALVNVQDSNGDTALHIAASWGYTELVGLLIENGASLLITNNFYMTPLHLAAINGHKRSVALLLEYAQRGEEELSEDIIDEILYVIAESRIKNPEIQDLLLAYQSGESAIKLDKNEAQNLSLLAACESGDYEKVKDALGHGASPDSTDEDDTSALRWASRKGHVNIVRLLLEHGADVNKRSDTGWSPLMEASSEGMLEIVSILIENGAFVDAKTYVNATSLIFASKGGYAEIVRILLKHGADPGIRIKSPASDSGKDAMKVAMENGHEDIARLIMDSIDRGRLSHSDD